MTETAARLAHIKAISFDLDDTLWDCAPVIARAEQCLYEWLCEQTPRITHHYSLSGVKSFLSQFAEAHPEYRIDVTFLRKEALKALFSTCDYPRDLAEPAFECFYQARSDVVLYSDAIPVLQALKSRYKLAALTNGNANLTQIGIAHLFNDIQAASINLSPKPHRAMFDKTASALGVELGEILHVGDNPATDIFGGQAAGTMTVWFNQYNSEWPAHLIGADFEIQTLSELPSLLPQCRKSPV